MTAPAAASKDALQFQGWIRGLAFVDFHLEEGQSVDVLFPGDCLSADQCHDLGFLALPEIGVASEKASSGTLECSYVCILDRLFVGVFFRRSPDKQSKRGFSQQSVCVISLHPYIRLLRDMARTIGHALLRGSAEKKAPFDPLALFARVRSDIDSWPRCRSGISCPHLGLLDAMLAYKTPLSVPVQEIHITNALLQAADSPSPSGRHPIFPFEDAELGATFCAAQGPTLWTIWELLIRGSPLFVLGPSPQQVSAVVFGCLSLIAPLRFSGLVKPYLTLHDSAFRQLSSWGVHAPVGSAIVGCSNPFFLKAFSDWPHFLCIGDQYLSLEPEWIEQHLQQQQQQQQQQHLQQQQQPTHRRCVSLSANDGIDGSRNEGSSSLAMEPPSPSQQQQQQQQQSSSSSPSSRGTSAGKMFGQFSSWVKRKNRNAEFSKRFVSTVKHPTVPVDRHLLACLAKEIGPLQQHSSCMFASSAILRRYFSRLTEAFLRPLILCLVQTWNSQSFDSMLSTNLDTAFSRAVFLAYVTRHNPVATEAMLSGCQPSAALDLYRAFLETDTFLEWRYALWMCLLSRTLREFSAERIVGQSVHSKSDEQKIDLCLRVRQLECVLSAPMLSSSAAASGSEDADGNGACMDRCSDHHDRIAALNKLRHIRELLFASLSDGLQAAYASHMLGNGEDGLGLLGFATPYGPG